MKAADIRKKLMQEWANVVWRATQSKGIFGRKSLRIEQIMAVAGPRVGALEIDAGYDAGDLLKKLRASDHALHRQMIPWHFSGNPIVYMARRYVRLEAGWPEDIAMTDIKLAELGQHGSGKGRWIAGMNEQGATITLGFNDRVPHYLFGGYTGSGKSTAMRAAIAQLALDGSNRLVLIDGKYGDGLLPLQNLPHVVGPVATSIPAARKALSWTVSRMRQRFEAQQKQTTRIIVVIDEIQEFTKDEAITEFVRILSAQGRGACVHLMIGTQHPKSDAFGGESAIKRNLPGRIALMTEDYKASEVVVGGSEPRADHLMGAGDAYAITPRAIHRAQMAYIPDGELARDWCIGQPELKAWPAFDPEAAGTLPVEQEGAVKWDYSGEELAVGLIQAAEESGRPALKEALVKAGLGRPGSGRADRLLNLTRDALASLQKHNWQLLKVNIN
jgi:hypothetical protein